MKVIPWGSPSVQSSEYGSFYKVNIVRNEIRTDLIERIIKDLEISGSTTVIRSYNKKPVNIICRTC